jgi:hypothetical protein
MWICEDFMRNKRVFTILARHSAVIAAMLALGVTTSLALMIPNKAPADEPKSGATSGSGVATCVSETATLLRRSPGEKTWQIVTHNQSLPTGDLLVGLPGAVLESKNGSIRLELLADLDRLSPYPIRESAVQL